MAKTKSAIVNCSKSKINIYSTTNSNKKNKIGSVKKGVSVTIIQEKVVKGNTWAKIKGTEVQTGWVIMKRKGSKTSILDTTNTASKAVAKKKNKTTTAAPDSGSVNRSMKETTGIVKYGNKKYNTGEVSQKTKKTESFKNKKNVTKLKSYEIKYDKAMEENFARMRKSLNIDPTYTAQQLFVHYTKYYNRFKMAHPDDTFVKSFGHVFFTRPDTNIITYAGGSKYKLNGTCKGLEPYASAYNRNLDCLKQLVINTEYSSDFMMYLSNKVVGFEERDRNIEYDSYGKTLQGHSIQYGKHIIRSESAGELSLTFNEDKNLHILNLFNIWVNYISDAYTGRITPAIDRIFNKELDYASSLYYIVTDETGENIIYWSKYYGIFPTSIPDSVSSWQKGNFNTNPDVTVSFAYSRKKALDTNILYELNLNARNSTWKYAKTYQNDILTVGQNFVGAPFVEISKINGIPAFKLRFKFKA